MNIIKTTEAGELYKSGKNTIEIGKLLNISRETARKWVISSGVPFRTRKERQTSYKRNSNAFSIISPTSAYYAGFLMADGNVGMIKKSKMTSLELQLRDIEIINGFKAFLEYEGPIHFRTRKSKKKFVNLAYMSICDDIIFGDLEKWGVIPNKHKFGRIPKWVLQDKSISTHFMRGLFDGDGCIHIRPNGNPFSSFANNPIIAKQFYDWINEKCEKIGGIDKRPGTWVVQYGCLSVTKMLTVLYGENQEPNLSRKYDLFQWIKKHYKNQD